MSSRTQHAVEIELLVPSQVTTDRDVNTRPVDTAWVARKLREGFDLGRLGVPQVSARSDGTYIWLDGQNRGALCVAADHGETKIGMKVFRGLTKEQEAELFLGLNDNRRVQPLYKFMAEVTAGHAESLDITHTARDHGWIVSDSGAGNAIIAVAALRKIYGKSAEKGQLLRRTLRAVTESWGHIPAAGNSYVLLGVASVLYEFPFLDSDALVRKLSKLPGGPASLLGKGRGYKEVTGGTVVEGIARVVRDAYNSGRRSGRLVTESREPF
ncbi:MULTISPECIES: DUF6551 family protein [Streptomyces]|uniref:DUF6551 family protein n=1 Tax=Streptomyces TaxID=1883 RepID=UPI00117ED889|nr:DUF6551 family protein [Streptomyces kasugaensis]